MACGCSDNKLNNKKLDNDISNNNKLNDISNNLNNNKILYLEDMKNMSIDEIIKLYQDGYSIEDLKNNVNMLSDIISMNYDSQCSGGPDIALNNTGSLQGTSGVVQKGMVWAQKFSVNYRCLEMVEFSVKKKQQCRFLYRDKKRFWRKTSRSTCNR